MLILGVDPGSTGALAFYEDALDTLIAVHDFPVAQHKVGKAKRNRIVPELLADIIEATLPDVAFVEEVHALPKQGVSSTFAFGVSFGLVLGVLAARRISVTLVTPNTWQQRMGVRGKDATRARACQLWPRHSSLFARVKDDGRADAALIAAYGSKVST